MKLPVAPLVMLSLSACASFGTFLGQEGEVQLAPTPESNMAAGDQAMEGKNFAEAAAFYEFVKTKYPYLELAKTAELRLADCDYERDRFVEARDRYQNFVRLHPTHPKIDYAAYRAALTHYREFPSDFFLLPPASEKDQVEVRNALSAMMEFTRNHPGSEYVKDAKQMIAEVQLRLAEHELYVADFYARRERWPAVVLRLNVVAKNYSGIGLDERVAFGLCDAYLQLKDSNRARQALQMLVDKFPDTPGAKKALARMGELPPPFANHAPATPDAGT